MSAQNDNPADPFKKALAEATKVMANDPDLSVAYSVDPPGANNDTIRLPQVTRRMSREEVLLARGTADALALRHKFHDASTAARYAPQGQMARDIYDAMETARCEAVGARYMPGTAGNIDAKIESDALRRGYDGISEAAQAPLADAAGYLVRHMASGRPLPKGANNVMTLWRDFIESKCEGLGALEDVLNDQAQFAKFARQMIQDWAMATNWVMTPMVRMTKPKTKATWTSKRKTSPTAPAKMTATTAMRWRPTPNKAKTSSKTPAAPP